MLFASFNFLCRIIPLNKALNLIFSYNVYEED